MTSGNVRELGNRSRGRICLLRRYNLGGPSSPARELLLDEAREGPRLGADLSSRRKNSPKIDRRQQPIVQYGFHRAGFELGREHPVRGDRKAQPRRHAFPNTLRSAHSNAAVDNNRDFGAASSERPRRSAPALVVDDSLVLCQIGRGSRNTHPQEIGRRANHAPLVLPDFACRERGIGELAHAQRYVYASFDQVFVCVAEKDLDVEGRVLRQEKGKARYDVKPRKRDRHANAQTPRQGCARTARGEFGLFGFLDGPFRAFVEIPPGLGRRQTVRRTQQQAHPETERAIAALKLGVAASRALSAVYAIKVVIGAPGNPLALEQNLKNSAGGGVAVGLDYRSFPPGMSCDGTHAARPKLPAPGNCLRRPFGAGIAGG
jgi:hypothetical protein